MPRLGPGLRWAVPRLAIAAAAVLSIVALAGAAGAQKTPDELFLSPMAAPPGETVKAWGTTSVCPGSPNGPGLVELVWWERDVVGTARAKPGGSFSGSLTVPVTAEEDAHLVQARCVGTSTFFAQSPFEVIPPPTQPSSVPPPVPDGPTPRRATPRPQTATPTAAPQPAPRGTGGSPEVAPVPAGPESAPVGGGSYGGGPAASATNLDASVPTAAAGAAGERAPTDEGRLRRSAFAASVPDVTELTHDLGAVLGSLALAGLLILLVGFPAELFNKTLEENYDEVRGWFPWARRVRSAPSIGRTILRFAAFALIATAVYSLLDPEFGLDVGGLALAVGLLAAIVVTTLVFELPIGAYLRRATGEVVFLRTFPGALVVAVGLLAMSRVADFQPGYVYGIFAGYALIGAGRVSRASDGRSVALASVCLGVVSVAAWLAWTPVNDAAQQDPGVGILILDSVLVAIFVAGLETLAIGLAPVRFLDGHKLASWSRPLWLLVQGVAMFGFVYVLLRPETGGLETSGEAPVVGMLALFTAFGVASALFWAYFRFRSDHDAAPAAPVQDEFPSSWYTPDREAVATTRRSS